MFHTWMAVLFLGLLAAVLVGWAALGFRRSRYSTIQTLLYLPAMLLVKLRWGARLPPGLPLRPGEGGVIVANHRSSIDPFFVQVIAGRDVHWMVAKEFCDSAAFGWFLRWMEAIPTNRAGIDTAATKLAIRYVRQGSVIGMFPEGRINMTDELLLPVRPGAAMIALKAGVPMVPCYIEGSPYAGSAWSPFLMPAKAKVKFGAPIDVSFYADRADDRDAHTELTLLVMKEIAKLAGRDDFEPQLAGRQWKPTEAETVAANEASAQRNR
ncbi:MAG TPA: lysophospholipid acyltransferase family protein [Pirellulaceae bacterium]|nr:lysophospholipid acyltransferase family protein [Pirellulaceae bacterium]